MAHRLLIPTPLRPYAEQQAAVEVDGANVGEALASLTTRYTDLRRHLYSDDGRLRSFVNVYVNDQDIRQLERDATRLQPGDVISIVPSVAGGAPVTTRTDTGHGRTRTDTENEAKTQDPSALPELTSDEFQRYSRHLLLPEVGVDGQRRLKAARVLCVGAGGLGSPAALYLAAAGIGTLGIVDFDAVDASNLQRQILHSTADVGRSKLHSARDRLSALNPSVHIEMHDTALSSANALDIFRDYDVVIDGTDNFATRYLVNDACVLLGKPNAYGSIFRFEGQASVFATAGGPCYRCLYPEPPPPGLVPSCAEGGVLGVLPGVIGTIQATETIKLILGAGTTLAGRLLLYDAWTLRFREMKLRRDPDCPVCGDAPTIRELIDYEQFCGAPRAAAAPGPTPLPPELETNVDDLHARVQGHEPPYILDVREPQEFQICRIPGSTLIPLGELPARVAEVRAAAGNREIVVHCKGGTRSAKAVHLLREQGFDRIKNLKGGILAWIDRVDPSLPKY
jgi:molybdopterin/thiamine biosynthesis adenylyltransferase/rhodanese-related sulfurtransferase/molybdopterin converting factor small subunit